MSDMEEIVRAAVKLNMRSKAAEQELSAAGNGVGVVVETRVFAADGSKNYATVLADALCGDPQLAGGTRQDLANLITVKMNLDTPFNPTRLSRVLSARAKLLVDKILRQNGYNSAVAETGMGIRDAVRFGAAQATTVETGIKTTFRADGVTLDDKFYAYERVVTYETEMSWYYLGLRFAGHVIPLKTVLAMRGIGISQFIGLDEAAHECASAEQVASRKKLLASL